MATYAELSRGAPPATIVKQAVNFCTTKNSALDLGAGSLRNAKYLLEEGFEVTAVDKDEITKSEAEKINDPKLTVLTSRYGDFDFQESAYDLIIAINSLPFEIPEAYPALFNKVKASLKPQGILAMTFFGPNDDWAQTKPRMTFHSRADIESLCSDLQIESLEEVEEEATTIQGDPKHWHLFRLIARKN